MMSDKEKPAFATFASLLICERLLDPKEDAADKLRDSSDGISIAAFHMIHFLPWTFCLSMMASDSPLTSTTLRLVKVNVVTSTALFPVKVNKVKFKSQLLDEVRSL